MNFVAIIIGAVTGFVSAFFGIGGSSIDTPVIRTFLGLPPLQSLATPLPLTVLTASIAMFAYRKGRLADYRITGLSLITAVPGVVFGSLLTAYIPGQFLMLLTAVVLALVGIDFIVKDFTEKTLVISKPRKRVPAWQILLVAGFISILSGVLANGGGIFFVPAFVVLFRLRIKEAIATSLPLVLILALPGSAVQLALGHVDLATMATMAIGVVPMAFIGAKLDIHTRSKLVMLLYGVVMLVFAVYFFISQLR